MVGYSCKLMGGGEGEFEDVTEFVGEDEEFLDVLDEGGVRGGLPWGLRDPLGGDGIMTILTYNAAGRIYAENRLNNKMATVIGHGACE